MAGWISFSIPLATPASGRQARDRRGNIVALNVKLLFDTFVG
jgi:hypothetical protein